MEEVDFDIELRLKNIDFWQEDIKKEYPAYAKKSHALMVHYLNKYTPKRLKIYLGFSDREEESEHHLDDVSSLYGRQSLIASFLEGIEKGKDFPLELMWYIHRALEIEMSQEDIINTYKEIAELRHEYDKKAYGIFETYLKNYKPFLLPYYLDKRQPKSHADNMEAIDLMVCHFWLCDWLKQEGEGKRTRTETDFDIRKHMKLPPNMIPDISGKKPRRRISHPFTVIEGGGQA